MKKLLQLLNKQALLLCLVLISATMWGQNSTFFNFAGTSGYLATPGTGWTSTGSEGGGYLKLSPGSVTSPQYAAASNIVFKYDIGSFGSGTGSQSKLIILSATNVLIQEYSLFSTSGGGTYTKDQVINVGSISSTFKVKIEGYGNGSQIRGTRLQNYSLVGQISPLTAPVVTEATVNGTYNTAVNYQIIASNVPTSYALISGTLPTGLTLNTLTGVISGTPTVIGISSVEVTATNVSGTSTAATLSFNIAKANQTITFADLASIQYGGASFNLAGASSSNLDITYTSSNSAVATVSGNIVEIVGVGSTNITASQAGNNNYNAATNVVQSLNVDPKTVTITGLTGSSKVYNALTNAELVGNPILNDVLVTDQANIQLNYVADYQFADANVGANKAIIANSFSLSGSSANNYLLVKPTGLTGDIIAKEVVVSGVNTQNKVYDGTTSATVAGGALSGVLTVDIENVTISTAANFATANVGTGISVNVNLTGSKAANYMLTQPDVTADITPETLTITGINVPSRIYNGSTTATLGGTAALSGILAGDALTVSLIATDVLANFTTAAVGTGKAVAVTGYALVGTSSSNYTLTQPTSLTGTVTTKALNILGLTADNKLQDGTTNATLSGTASLNGIISGDEVDVTLTGTPTATFASASSGTGIVVSVTGYSLTGSKAINYSLTTPALAADITALGTPFATAGTAIASTSFTANWNAVEGATDYELDVYQIGTGGPAIITTETFTAIGGGNAGSYLNRSWTGIGEIGWSAYKARTDQVITSGNEAITLRDQAGSYLQSDAIVGGLSNISFDVKQFFGGSGGILTIKVLSGATFSTVTTIGTIAYNTTASTYDSGLLSGISGDYKILIENNASARPAIDNLSFTGLPTSLITYNLQNENVGNVNSYEVTGLNPGNQYYYVIRAVNGTPSPNSNEVGVTLFSSTTWNGNSWSHGLPTNAVDAIIEGSFTMTSNLNAKSLTINEGILIVGSNTTLNVENEIVNALSADNFIIENDAVVLQNSNLGNTALATVKRNSSNLYRQDYTSWSSPVTGQNLRAFSEQTIFSRFYSYSNAIAGPNNLGDYQQELFTNAEIATKTFNVAQGYLIRMPNNWPVFTETAIPGTPYLGVFKGVLNNGTYSISLSEANVGFNLVGNPYPSPISITEFFEENATIPKVLYFWRKRNGVAGSGYATYSTLGTTSVQPEGIVANLDDTIKPGQGFYVTATEPTTLVFNNAMRTATAGTAFFKSSETTETSRFWLNLSDDTNFVSQTLIGYTTNATEGIDNGIDAAYFSDSPLALTSIVNGAEFSIQGKGLPFVDTDIVNLGFKSNVTGNFTISLPQFDGLFLESQDILLKDNNTGIYHNLKSEAYTFTTEIGIFNNRFEVHYNTILNTENPSMIDNQILLGVKDQKITINSGTTVMEKVDLIDLSGRVIYSLDNIQSNTVTLVKVSQAHQALIVRIRTTNNEVVNQKIIF